MNVMRIIYTYFRLGILSELEYRANFFIQILQSALGLLVGIGGLVIVFNHTETLGGWRSAELLALIGIFTLVGGLINLVIQPSMQRFMEDVRLGTLDFKLTKPEDAQLLISVQQMQVWKLVDIGLGLGVLAVALRQLSTTIGVTQALTFGLTMLCGGAIVYSFWLILATFSFWLVKIENILVIFQSMYQAGRWPVSIYPLWLRTTLTFIVPVAFAVTVPAEGLVGRLTGPTLLGAVGLSGVLLVGSRLFWRIGIRYYSGASA